MDKLSITGAKAHNLKGVDVEIPLKKLVVVTGLSGSGKSTLAFDTIYAEGQRRYMETLSAYARQYIGILERPDVESISGLSPVIAIEQKTTGRNPRSTVGTMTEIYDFLRLLYARVADAYSPHTGRKMVKYTNEQIVELIIRSYKGKKILLLSPLVVGRKGHYKELFESLLRKGYQQVRVDGTLYDVAQMRPLDRYKVHFIELVIDKLIPSDEDYKRISSSVSTALEQGKGTVAVIEYGDSGHEPRYFSRHLMCPESGMSLQEPAPHTFSFNSPQGACPRCKGLGFLASIDLERIFPDKSKSINQGGIGPLGAYKDNNWFRILEAMSRKMEFSLNEPVGNLSEDVINALIYGSDTLFRVNLADGTQLAPFPGIMAKLEQQLNELEWQRGNPGLRFSESVEVWDRFTHELWGGHVSARAYYIYTQHNPTAATLREGTGAAPRFVHTWADHTTAHTLTFSLGYNRRFLQRLNVGVYGEWNRCAVRGTGGGAHSWWYGYANLSYAHKGFMAGLHVASARTRTGGSLVYTHTPATWQLYGGYRWRRLTLMAAWQNPWRQASRSFSTQAPAYRTQQLTADDASRNAVLVQLSWNVSFGRKHKFGDVELRRGGRSGIVGAP